VYEVPQSNFDNLYDKKHQTKMYCGSK